MLVSLCMSTLTHAVNGMVGSDLRRQAASAMVHPLTLAALGLLLVNDHLFKQIWPGGWAPGKLSDLAWMVFAPPVLAYVLSLAARRNWLGQQAAFAASYAGLPLLYVAFNTFQPVHDAVLRGLALAGEGPRSPLDSTDSLVIPFAMAAALWVWRRPLLSAQGVHARLTVLVAVGAALTSVASTYDVDHGVTRVERAESGTIRTVRTDISSSKGTYESADGGFTWTQASETDRLPGSDAWGELEITTPSGTYFGVTSAGVVRRDGNQSAPEVVYSYEHLWSGGNRWQQALDTSDIPGREIARRVYGLFYDDVSGNLIVAMGVQGVVVVAPDGRATRAAVGPYSPTDFSFAAKTRTLISLLLDRDTGMPLGIAVALSLSLATLALAVSTIREKPERWLALLLSFLAAGISVFIGLTWGVYPQASESPFRSDSYVIGEVALDFAAHGLVPFATAAAGLALTRPRRRDLLAVAVTVVVMLLLMGLGALVLFEEGVRTANLVAMWSVGLAAVGLWAYLRITLKRSVPK